MFLCVSLARRMNCELMLTTNKKYKSIKKLSSGATLRNRGVLMGEVDWGRRREVEPWLRKFIYFLSEHSAGKSY